MKIKQIAAIDREINANITNGNTEMICPIVGLALTEEGEVRGLVITPDGKIEFLDRHKPQIKNSGPLGVKPPDPEALGERDDSWI